MRATNLNDGRAGDSLAARQIDGIGAGYADLRRGALSPGPRFADHCQGNAAALSPSLVLGFGGEERGMPATAGPRGACFRIGGSTAGSSSGAIETTDEDEPGRESRSR